MHSETQLCRASCKELDKAGAVQASIAGLLALGDCIAANRKSIEARKRTRMAQLANATPERQANHFVNHIFARYPDDRNVRRVALRIAGLLLFTFLSGGCGSGNQGPPALSVKPGEATLTDNLITGTIQLLQLQATLSNGQVPTGLVWSTTNQFLGIDQTGLVGCNIQAPTGFSAQAEATWQGQKASATIICAYIE